MEYMKNTSYFFVPFKYEKYERFKDLTRMLDESDSWDLVHDEIIYMMKYVADKLDSRKPEQCLCFHYEWNGRKREDFSGLKDWFSTKKHPFQGTEISFRFQLIGIQLYCFSTSVCIMVFQVQFEKNDPNYIASAEYYLKKVGREKIFSDQNPNEITFLKIAEKLMREVEEIGTFDYFYYANPSTERANVLSYLEMEKKEDYREDLFFLRYCYSEGFLYTEDQEREKKEIYQSSHDMIWGVSQEAAVCITCPEMGRGTFIRTTFYRNFNYQYLYMYILLLHQKYVLYMFLTEIGVGRYNTLETLEEYRRRLYEFEADFVFSCVTEVAQYQRLYDRMTDVFALFKRCNKYIDETMPWALAKDESKKERLEEVLYNLVESITIGANLLKAFMPNTTESILKQLYPDNPAAGDRDFDDLDKFGLRESGNKVTDKPEILFARLDIEEVMKKVEELQEAQRKANGVPEYPVVEKKPEITFDDFEKIQIQVGEVLKCEPVKKAKKLLCSQIRIGEEVRQIVSGISQYYKPEEMVGKKVAVVTNLAPRKICGVESQGMILAAMDDKNNLSVMTVDKDIIAGSEIG